MKRKGKLIMKKSNKRKKIKKTIHTSLDEILPRNFRKIFFELEDNPLWFMIGDYLRVIPIREKVDRLRLIDELSVLTKEDYYRIRDALNKLEEKGYIYVERASKPDHFLAPHFAEAMRLREKFETEVLNPILDEMKSDPEFSECKNLGKSIKRAIYSALI